MAIINSARELDVYKLAYKLALLNGMIKRTGELAMGRAGDGENWRWGELAIGRTGELAMKRAGVRQLTEAMLPKIILCQ